MTSIKMKKKLEVKNSGVVILGTPDTKRGGLFVAEAKKHIPFEIKRVYFINKLSEKSVPRGDHAHKTNTQVIVCLNGSFDLHLDDGTNKQTLCLDNPSEGIILGPKLWHTMKNFSNNCTIAVFASHYYDEQDYIRHYSDFLTFI